VFFALSKHSEISKEQSTSDTECYSVYHCYDYSIGLTNKTWKRPFG